MANSSRETQKNRLKRQMVRESRYEYDAYERHGSAAFRRYLPAVGLVLFLLFSGVYFYLTNKQYQELSVVWEKTEGDGARSEAFRGFERFAKGMIRYSKDGAAYVDQDGKTIWERSYQMQNPIAAVGGNYAVIADQGGQNIYIFNDSLNTGLATTVLPVSRVSVSHTGVVYATLKDDKADYITAFKADGSAIDLSIKSIITGDGYPVDIAVSPDGTELLTSYVAIENGQLQSKVIFRNFDEVGKEADARRVVGGFMDEFAGHMVGRVHFSSNEFSQAFYDGGVAFFSTKVLTKPELLSNVPVEEEINSIACSEDYAALICNTNGGEYPYRLLVYKTNGTRLAETEFSFPYTNFEIDGNYILLYNEDACRIYNVRGKEKLSAEFPLPVSKMIKCTMPGEFLLSGGNQLVRVRMR